MQRRFWQVYNIVVVAVIVVLGLLSMLDGTVRGAVIGAALIVGGGYLASRMFRATRTTGGAPTLSELRFDDRGIVVVAGRPEAPATAWLPWSDCVAVVASPAAAGGRGIYYLHFMPRSDVAVHLEEVPGALLRQKAAVADLPVSPAVAMVWLCTRDHLPRLLELLDQIRATHPDVRVVDSIGRGVDGLSG